ncbi:MAG: shikimate dehydrogenase [Pyrinomonadaceae bacterium]
MNQGKICVSVCAETADEMIANIKRAEEFADVVEVRFDCLRREQIEICISKISNCKFQILLLATFRSTDQGGNGNATFNERLKFWDQKPKEFWGGDFEEEVISCSDGWTNRIVSAHDFQGIPSDLGQIHERMAGSEAGILKIAVTANDVVDCLPVWELLDLAKTNGNRIIPIAMGEAGKWTRVLGLAHGAFMTYASLDEGKETADGQITANDLVETYRVKLLDRDTEVFGVIGDPVARSLSPYMHNAAFVAAGLNAVFIPLLVINLDQFIRRMVNPATREVELNFGGFSVTMPHKQAMMKHLDAIDPIAEKIGAVNTVKVSDGKLTGYNTDAHGFVTPLKRKFGSLKGARVAVFGAGGASRACIYALKQEGAEVTVFARDPARGEEFANEFDVKLETVSKLKDQSSKIDFDIVVNATPLGMKGPLENDSLFTSEELSGVKLVFDLITSLSETPITREAKKAGIPAIGGFEMLVAQGAKQFEIWTGNDAPVELMRDAIVSKMGRKKNT